MRRLLVRPGAIGDCLCSLPALYHLRGDQTEIWTNGAVAPLVGFGDRVRSLAGTGFDRLGIPGVIASLELVEILRGFDEILTWSGHNQPALRDRAHKLDLPIHFFPALPEHGAPIHVSDFILEQTIAWHGARSEPEEWIQPSGRRFLLTRTCAEAQPNVINRRGARPLVVLHPYSGSALKNWPLDRFLRLAESLSTKADIRWCASLEDPLPDSLAASAWRHPDLCSLARDLTKATIYVGNDSGITHLAAMLGIPTVVFFGPMNPVQWLPRGSRVFPICTRTVGQPVSDIPLEQAQTTVLSALQEIGDISANRVR